jgi:hypothetical protein
MATLKTSNLIHGVGAVTVQGIGFSNPGADTHYMYLYIVTRYQK